MFYLCVSAILLVSTIPSFCQDSLAFNVSLQNVIVPQEQIVLDSFSNGSYYYSGTAFFDLTASVDSVNLHVFLEEVPFQRYRIMKPKFHGIDEDTFSGNVRFDNIDSLCSGDVGWVKPKYDCKVNWRYSTKNVNNHCRIKIGIGNYYYANTKTETRNSSNGVLISKKEFYYNNIGLLSKNISTDYRSGNAVTTTKIPKYTSEGQVLVDDTTTPFVKNAYDTQGRAIFRQEADAKGYQINFIYGYVYDSLSRAIQRHSLPFGAQPFQDFQDSARTEYITYNNFDRISTNISNFRYEKFACQRPYDFIEGKLIMKLHYGSSYSNSPDSTVRDYFDKNRNYRLVSRIINTQTYRPDGLLEKSNSLVLGFDDPGTCWGTQLYEESNTTYHYDTMNHLFRYESSKRESADSVFTSGPTQDLCYRREYDSQGNTIKQFDFCDQQETLAWVAEYNRNNYIITLMVNNSIQVNTITNYQWELLDLDKQEEFLHD